MAASETNSQRQDIFVLQNFPCFQSPTPQSSILTFRMSFWDPSRMSLCPLENKMSRSKRFVYLAAILLIHPGCQASHPNAAVGGLLGGTTGGMMGAAIGSHEGKTGEGALIGALAGGVTGAVIGNQTDEANLRYRQAANQNAIAAEQAAVTNEQVIEMTRSGLSDEVISNQIKTSGVAQRVSTQDIIELKSQGVSDLVIRQLQTTSVQPILENRTPPLYAPGPVINVNSHLSPIYRPRPIYRPLPFRHAPGHHRRIPPGRFF